MNKIKLLILGDDLKINGGVPNYTRPLFVELQKLTNVIYLFTGSYLGNYTLRLSPKLIEHKENIFEIINTKALSRNYHNPLVEVSEKKIEKIFEEFLIYKKITHVHIHSMLGFPSSIYKIIKKLNISLIVTVHEYWWLCMHLVMIDYKGNNCLGPDNLDKCTKCIISKRNQTRKPFRAKLPFVLKNTFPLIFEKLLKNYKIIKTNNNSYFSNANIKQKNGKDIYINKNKDILHMRSLLEHRLNSNIDSLNLCDKVIAVSSDVKMTLSKYGVNSENVLVQHIGSLIAKKKIKYTRSFNSSQINFGFIGGVNYYKGIHVLVAAFVKLDIKYNANLYIYGKFDESYKKSIEEDFKEFESFNKVKFLGRFSAEQLPSIYPTIDIMVLPSICSDTAPQTIFESYVAKIPIIGSNIGGFPDFIEHDRNGLLFEAGASEDLKEKMEYILENPGKIEDYSKNIPKLKTIVENAKELIELYKSI